MRYPAAKLHPLAIRLDEALYYHRMGWDKDALKILLDVAESLDKSEKLLEQENNESFHNNTYGGGKAPAVKYGSRNKGKWKHDKPASSGGWKRDDYGVLRWQGATDYDDPYWWNAQ